MASHSHDTRRMRQQVQASGVEGNQWAMGDGALTPPLPDLNPPLPTLSLTQERGDSVAKDNNSQNESEGDSTALPSDRDSGFTAVLIKLGDGPQDPDTVEKELNWQRLSRTDPSVFKTTVVSTFTFRALMQANSPYIMLCQSIGQFSGEPGNENKGLHGKCIAFVRDQRRDRDPMVVILPEEAWEWTQPFINGDTTELEDYYEPGKGNDATFFIAPAEALETVSTTRARGKQVKQSATGTSTDALGATDAKASKGQHLAGLLMLSLPTTIFEELIRMPYRTPVDLMEMVGAFRDNYDLQIGYSCWSMMTDWCIAATQARPQAPTRSVLAITVDAVAQEDETFHTWCTSRVTATMGAHPRLHVVHQPTPRTPSCDYNTLGQ